MEDEYLNLEDNSCPKHRAVFLFDEKNHESVVTTKLDKQKVLTLLKVISLPMTFDIRWLIFFFDKPA